MAESIGELYMRIGLDISDLESDFVNAEKTLTENLNKLSREQHLIQIRGQIELDGLEESASASEKVRVQAEALNKQMELQRDKIALVSAAYQQLVRTQGENAESTQSAAFQLEKEKLALSNLEKQTRDLSKQQEIALGVNTEMLGLIPMAVKAVDAAVQAGRTLPIPVGHAKVLAGVVAGLAAVAAGSHEATQEMRDDNPAKVLSEDFEQAQEDIDASWQEVLSTTEQSTGDMTSTVEDSFSEMADGITESVEEISDTVEDCTSNISKIVDILKSNSADEALSKTIAYFEEMDSVVGDIIADILKVEQTMHQINTTAVEMATPAIQGFRELSLAARELNLPLDKTNDLLGEIKLAGGEYNDIRDYVRGVQDAVIKGEWDDPEVLALERYGVSIQDANGHLLAFDETLERLYEGYLKAREAGEAESYVIMTNGQAVQDVLPFFEKWAQAKEDNAKIQWSILDKASLAEASRNMKLADTQIEEFKNQLSSLAVPMASAALESTFETFHKLTEVLQENRETIIYWSFVAIEAMNSVKSIANDFGISITGAAGSAADKLAELAEKFAVLDKVKNFLVDAKNTVVEWGNSLTGAQQSWADFQRQSHGDEQTLNPFANADKQMEKWRKSNQQAQGEIQKTNEELVGLGYSLKRIAEYQKELANVQLDLDFGKSQMLQVANVSQQAGSLVMSFRENIYQKAIAQENLWLEEALKSAKAYKDEQEAIYKLHAAKLERIEYEKEKRLAEIRESVYSDERSELENRLIDIEREKQAWIDAGMEEAEATELAQKKITQAYEEREAKLNDIRESVYSLDRTDLENKLANINKEKEAWIAAGMEEAEAESLAQRKRADIINSLNQEIVSHLESIWNTALENRLSQIEKEKQAWIKKGADEVKATKWAEQEKANAQRDAAMSVLKSQLEEFHAFQEGGYKGLRQYQLKQLEEAGISAEDLQMTPQMLEEFQKVQQAVQKSLLPNFMTTDDKNFVSAIRDYSFAQDQKRKWQEYEELSRGITVNGQSLPESDLGQLFGLMPKAELEKMPQSIADVNAQLALFDTGLQEIPIENKFSAFENILIPATEEISSRFAEMSARVSEVTGSLGNFGQGLSAPQQNFQATPQSAPPNITVTVQIEEAHAWDSQHIQELADKVADKITPALTSAIGGSSNSY